ncbi:MAG: MFS transporter [Firmicutes bacterium]|nr:MFS transporter [Bacillota bacterium]
MVILFILFGVLSFISDTLEQSFKLEGVVKGAVLSIPLLSMSVTAYLSGLYLRKKGKYYKTFYLAGLIVVGIAMGILPFCYQKAIVCPAVLALLGFGTGLVLPAINTMVTSSTEIKQRGGVTSLYGSVRFTGVALGPPAFSLLQGINTTLMFLSGAGVALAAGMLGYIFIKEKTIMQGSSGGNK